MTKISSALKSTVLHLGILLSFSIFLRLLYLVFFWWAPGSFDLQSWHKVTALLEAGKNPYIETELLNWPPLWMQVLFVSSKVAHFLQLPFSIILRTVLIFFESATEALLFITLLRFIDIKKAFAIVFFGMVCNPICILLVCQHSNFDVIVGFFILLALFFIVSYQKTANESYWLAATLAIGLGILTKTIPVLLIPVLFYNCKRRTPIANGLGLILTLLPATIGMGVIFSLAPDAISVKVLQYRSYPGYFGITGLLVKWGVGDFIPIYSGLFAFFTFGLMLYLTIFYARVSNVAPKIFYATSLFCLIIVPALGPGYALQYISWFIPLMAVFYSFSEGKIKTLILCFYAVAIISYAIQYLFQTSLGGLIPILSQATWAIDFDVHLSTRTSSTIYGLPLFLLYLTIIFFLSKQIFGRRNSESNNF